MTEPEAVLQGGEEQEHHEYDEIDIGGDAYRSETVLGDHFIFDLFFGQADEEGGRYDHKIGDHGDEPAVIVDQREQMRLAEEAIENLVEPPYQGNQDQNPPADPLAAVGHENAFVVHDSFYLFPSAKISLFFKMTNKLCIKTNKVVFRYSAEGAQEARLGTWQNASLSSVDGYEKIGSEPAPRVMGWELIV